MLHRPVDLLADSGMPHGKPAGVRCVQLTADNRCMLFGKPSRPAVCVSLRPSADMCGHSAEDACERLALLERATAPDEIAIYVPLL